MSVDKRNWRCPKCGGFKIWWETCFIVDEKDMCDSCLKEKTGAHHVPPADYRTDEQ